MTKRRWITIAALLAALLLFGLTDINERQQAAARVEHQKRLVTNQEKQIRSMEEQLILARTFLLSQCEMSDIEFWWIPSEELFPPYC